MKKPILLIGNADYYPCGGTDDWVGCFESEELAKIACKELQEIIAEECDPVQYSLFKAFKSKYNISDNCGLWADHFTIVDLREWQ